MKTYTIAAKNSMGLVVSYLDDGTNKMVMFIDLGKAKEQLEDLQLEGPHWADFKVMQIVEVE